MRLSTSRVLALVSNSGLSTDGWPTSASTAVPPRAGLGTVATGWHPASARTAANAATKSLPREMRRHPDVGYRADEERDDQDPGGPVDLAPEAAPGAVPAAEPGVAAADRPAEARRLGCLNQHAGHEEDREHGLRDDERVLELSHGTRRFYPRPPRKPIGTRTGSRSPPSSGS